MMSAQYSLLIVSIMILLARYSLQCLYYYHGLLMRLCPLSARFKILRGADLKDNSLECSLYAFIRVKST